MTDRRRNRRSVGRFSTLNIVDSLAEMTRYKDHELLERSLAATLADLFPNEEFHFYRISVIEQDGERSLKLSLLAYANQDAIISETHGGDYDSPPWLLDLMEEAIEHQDLVEWRNPNTGVMNVIYPVYGKYDDIYAALLHVSFQPSFDAQRLIYGLLRIYSNYLALLEESHRDTLTNLLNREILNAEITKIIVSQVNRLGIDEAQAQHRRILDTNHAWLCLIDIDHFKRINDNWGHLYGDEVLILMARLLETIFRQEDLLFRYGGEEFVVIFHTFSTEDAEVVCERVRCTIEQHSFPGVGQVTVSIGVAEIIRQPGASIVIGQADRALYYAKEHGRNQNHFYERLLEHGLIEEQGAHQPSQIEFF